MSERKIQFYIQNFDKTIHILNHLFSKLMMNETSVYINKELKEFYRLNVIRKYIYSLLKPVEKKMKTFVHKQFEKIYQQ